MNSILNNAYVVPEAPGFRFSVLLKRIPSWVLSIGLPLSTVILGWLDYISGWEWSLFVLYAAPIFIAVWWKGRNAGLVMAVVSAITWWAANQAGSPYQTLLGYNLAMFSRFIYFAFAAIGFSAIRNKQETDAARIQMLEEHRQLEHDIVTVSEYEQQRIGQDLHDGLCQQLAAIGCAVRALADDLQARSLPEAEDAAHIEESIQQAVLEARSLARGIFPVHVDCSGLSTSLADLARTNSRLTGVQIQLTEWADVHVGDPEVAMHLYRIAQEAVANAVKHSGAHAVSISLEARDNELEMRIEDNGEGLGSVDMAKPGGMGLRTMRYRAQAVGAHLTIEPRPGGGTLVRCRLRVRTEPNRQSDGKN